MLHHITSHAKKVNRLEKMGSADCINTCGTTDTWRTQKSVCIEHSSLPPTYMVQSCGSLIDTTYDSSNDSISTVSIWSLSIPGMTSSPILKFSRSQISLASKLSYWSPSYVGLDIFLERGIIACQGSYWVMSSQLAIATEQQQRRLVDLLSRIYVISTFVGYLTPNKFLYT